MKRLFSLLLASLLLVLPLGALASGVVSYTADFYVADYANVLSDEIEGLIVLNNDQLDKACGAQIVVVTVNEVSSVASIENYAYTLFNQWGIGSKSKNNGLLILIAVNEGTYWMTPGKGLQDYLTAGDLDELAQEYFLPSAQTGNFDEAVRQLFNACFEKISVAYNAGVSVDDSLYYKWIQTGQGGTDGARFLSEPLRESQSSTPPAVSNPDPAPVTPQNTPAEEKGGSGVMPFIIIAVIVIAVLLGARRTMRSRPVRRTPAPPPPPAPRPPVNPYRTPVSTHRPPVTPPRSPMGGTRPPMSGNRPPMSGSRPPMGGSRAPMSGSRSPMGGSRAPMSGSRSPMGGGMSSRPSAPRTGSTPSRMGGGSTRGGGMGGSFGPGRPSGGSVSRPSSSRPSGGGFGGGRSGGGGSTRGGGSGGSFR